MNHSGPPAGSPKARIIDYPDHHLICWFPGGEVTSDEVLAFISHLQNCPWGHLANRFCDLTEVLSFPFDYSVLHEVAEIRQNRLRDHVGVKLVLYSKNPLGFGMSRMYQSLLERWPMEIATTQDLQEACRVLALGDLRLLERPRG